jgi:hypothetical protein
MNLCVLAYPILSTGDYERIQEFRCHNDELYYHVVEPHFTLAFPLSGWEAEPYIAEIRKQAHGFRAFDFCIRCAALDKDASRDLYHAFLVPDEGHGQFVKLHYRLVTDRFFQYRHFEVDFIPHMGVGNSEDPLKCVEMVESWNREEFAISGHIRLLDIANYENDTVQTLLRLPLDG